MTGSELTSRILTTLLRRQAAGSDLLLAVLREDHPTSRRLLDDRLQALHEQQLVARFDDVWLLTGDGLAVARRSDPLAFGFGIETPLTAPTPAEGRSSRTDVGTSLALSFLRAHRAAFGEAPFEWETRPRLRSRDRSGRWLEVSSSAAMKTFTYGPRGLEPVNALVDLWTEQRDLVAATKRLHRYAELAAAENDHPAKGPWRRWLGRAPLLLIAVPTNSESNVVARALREAAGAEYAVQCLFDTVPIGVASIEAVAEAGVDAALWWSPVNRRKQVWQKLRCGIESAREVSCAKSACHLTG